MRKPWLIWLTLLIALALDVLPLPGWVIWLRPSWVLLVLMYWALIMPYRVAVGYAFVVGLLLDLLQGSLLGLHALPFVLIIYVVAKAHKILKVFPMRQQMLVVFFLLLIEKIIIFAVQGFIGQLPSSWLYWLSILISTLLWPWVVILLHDWRHRAHFEV
jgi:rod shape-determining protein MreD